MSGIRMAGAGLGSGAESVPIYPDHPDADALGGRLGIQWRFTDVSDVIALQELEAIHAGLFGRIQFLRGALPGWWAKS